MINASPMSQFPQEKTLQDHIALMGRRWRLGLLAFLAVFMPAVLAAMLWPPVYRATATILIEQQEIPQDLVRTTITSFADQRIERISQRVMTTANLLAIIRAHDLYADELDTVPRETIIQRMRGDITREMISADVVDPRSGRPMEATIAFTVNYDNRSPELAARVANEITSLYLQENSQTRREQAAEASAFLADEADRLSEEIAMLEARLAEFKQANVDRLPELAELNLQLYERTETDLAEIQRQKGVLEERKIYLESELAQLSPSRTFAGTDGEVVLSPRDRLRVLQAESIAMRGIYSDRHPAVTRAERAIAALEAELGIAAQRSPQDLRAERLRLQSERAALVDRYSETHPDVARVDRQLEALEFELAQAEAAGDGAAGGSPALRFERSGIEEDADNPVYIQLRAQLAATELERAALDQKELQVTARLSDLESRLTQTPIIERDYYALTRDLEGARARYQEIRFGERSAQTAENLELDAKGERFTLIEPPLVPQQPVSPNRPVVVFLGFIAALAASVVLIAMCEVLDTSVHGPLELQEITGTAPLGVIPRILTDEDRALRRKRKRLATIGATAGVLLVLGITHFLVLPLDELWFRAMGSIGL